MPGISRVGVDTAGGTILGGGQNSVYVNGALAAVIGDSIENHGASPHDASVMVGGSTNIFVEGIGVCREGDAASCGDTATGSSDTIAN